MGLAELCLAALVCVLILSCVTSLNVGLAALAAAWIIGVYIAPLYEVSMDAKAVAAGFPVDLFLNLTGTTLLFAAAQVNGTLGAVVDRAVRLCGGRAWPVPIVYFLLAAGLSAAGPGNIAAAALLAPSAMALAAKLRIPPLVMIIAVAHGSIAGGASPLNPIGLIVAKNYTQLKLSDALTATYLMNAAVNAVLAVGGVLLFGGFAWMKNTDRKESTEPNVILPFSRGQIITLIVIASLITAAVLVANLHIGFAAFTGAAVLLLTRSADERESIRTMPWNVILMVTGVSVLVFLCEKTGAVDLLSKYMAYVADKRTIIGWSAFITGLISIFSSTSGVVLPTFLSAVEKFCSDVGGGDPRLVAMAIVIGSNAVDVSPLSTIGALCIASVKTTDTKPLFNRMLLWGFAMAPLSAIACQLLLR